MDPNNFFRSLPKVELHAHLNGSLSYSTMLKLKQYHSDAGLVDQHDPFLDEFQMGTGDFRNLIDCLQVFSIAQSLTSTPEALAMATKLTVKEFQDDGCCYVELRSTPRETSHMSRKQYIEAIIHSLQTSNQELSIMARLIVSIDRRSSAAVAESINDLAIEYYNLFPDVVVGIEISGDPNVGKFDDFVPLLEKARKAGLKVTLHCGEVNNPAEIMEMLKFKPDRIGHGICIHPRLSGTEDTWKALCEFKIPVEVCLTSNVNTKSITDFDSHHFMELYEAEIPVIICTDDKGVFATSLSQEYMLCAETFNLDKSQMAHLSLNACQYIFAHNVRQIITTKVQTFIDNYCH